MRLLIAFDNPNDAALFVKDSRVANLVAPYIAINGDTAEYEVMTIELSRSQKSVLTAIAEKSRATAILAK